VTGVISIDFETRSEEDLQRVGSWKYSRHPSSDITCIGWHIPGQPQPKCAANSNIASKAVVAAGADLRELLWYAANTDIPFEAHGAPFERSMWENTAVPRYGWPQIAPERWRCTMARARGISLPGGLEKAAEALRLSVSKDMEGSKIMRRMCKPQKGKYGGVKWVEDDASFLKLMAYCAQDVRTEMALSAALPPLSPTEFCIWRMDQAMNHRGIAIDRAHVESCVAILDEYNKIVNETVYHLTNGALKKVTEVAKALRWCISRGVVLPDLAANTIEPYLTVWADTIPEDVAAFLKLRYFAGKSSTKKYQAMLDAWDVRDYRVRNHINYCGAQRTRRFSGAIIQPQNYPRGVKGLKLGEEEFAAIRTGGAVAVKKLPFHLMDVMATGLRGSFVAGPGKVFYGGDLANIEVRVLFWLAGEEVGLDAYRRGEDLYILVAADIYGVAPADVTEDQRQMGKQVIVLATDLLQKFENPDCAIAALSLMGVR
jgi:DNA polymerase